MTRPTVLRSKPVIAAIVRVFGKHPSPPPCEKIAIATRKSEARNFREGSHHARGMIAKGPPKFEASGEGEMFLEASLF